MSILVSNLINNTVKDTYDDVFVFGLDGYYDACLAKIFPRTYVGKTLFVDERSAKNANKKDFIFVDRIPMYRNIELIINNGGHTFHKRSMEVFGPSIRRVFVEHRYTQRLEQGEIDATKRLYKNADVIFSSENVKNDWQLDGVVIPEFIEQKIDEQEKTLDIVIYGDFNVSDYDAIKRIQRVKPYNTAIIGDSPGLSRPMPYEDMLMTIAKAKVLVTFTRGLYAPPRILEAAMYKTAIVTNRRESSLDINHGVDGLLIDRPIDIPNVVSNLINDKDSLSILTSRAKEKVERINNIEQFSQKWSDVLYGQH